MHAITRDDQNRLRWSRKGHSLALDIAKGLVHLHANKVSLLSVQHDVVGHPSIVSLAKLVNVVDLSTPL